MQNFTIVSLANLLAVSAVKIVPPQTTDDSLWDLQNGMPVIDLQSSMDYDNGTSSSGS